MKNLIIASNRLPFRIDKKGSKYEVKQSSGGLVSALQSIPSADIKMSWVGVADFKKESWNFVKDNLKEQNCDIVPIFADKKKYHAYYNGFSNTLLWPLFHYFPSYAMYDEADYNAYKEINTLFAERISEIAQTGDTVWVHDYHLMLLPKLLKQRRPDLHIGFFLHIPFPSYEIFKLIPEEWRNEILEGIISSDVAGFHTPEYVSHFKRSLAYFSGITVSNDVVHLKEHTCIIRPFPISIDFNKFNDGFSLPAVERGRKTIKQKYKNTKIIFSVDRLDYTKGVIHRLQAYENLLETHPEYREKVAFVINVVPSRDQISKYAERKRLIEENIGRINGLYGSIHWQPVIYQYRHLTFNQLISFYSVADVALITPMRDGMNLVAKEFVASRKDKKGVLILSEFAGAASELQDAILVNPNDLLTLKHGIIKALSLNEKEKEERMEAMREVVKQNDIQKWIHSFISDLKKSENMNNHSKPHIMTFDEKVELFDCYRSTKNRLLLFDYDGTLVPYYTKPEEAHPSNQLKDLLNELNQQTENEVVIVSGRDAETLENWFGDTELSIVAEHGALYKPKNEDWKRIIHGTVDWKDDVKNAFDKIIAKYPGTFIERKTYSIALHYRAAKLESVPEIVSDAGKELMLLDTHNFNVIYGNMIIEVKNPETDKGDIVSKIIEEGNFDFILALGDDATDEDMFSALELKDNCYTVKVGITPTKAKCNLIGVSNVLSLLDQLNQHRGILNFNKN